jgi:hypothetical protein
MLCHHGRFDSNQLSSEYRVLRLPHFGSDQNIKPWVLFSSVGTLSCAFPSLRGERLSTSCLFPRFFYACLRPPLRY